MSARFIKAAVIYFLIGTVLGLVMGSAQAFEYTSVHAHINLAGWASLAIIGLIYKAYPELGEARLAKIQFWLHNVGLPLLIVSMVLFAAGNDDIGIPFAVLGGLLIIVSVILMTVNVFKRLKA
ncbi:cbb3-type cytochrome c oxidase subunit I [Cohnella pontilimi]|uniref:Cbb3-type cytochrome c oxidase subunit I n=1 Tax=Cohnella pontilimi TaxID=2564100 RepID=A0A4U0F4W3_9BACL|nr:cbb3-type cytochrome c oxidase subunit I [Cohnella pontilimi]TJY39616.1 cbb3-type cytochrome c oxidase subunit I [Cohnella pontilimi]